jgi:hypothetical protein
VNSRERVLRTLQFEPTNRPAYDLGEGIVWQELQDYFREPLGLTDDAAAFDFLDPDFRWVSLDMELPEPEKGEWLWQRVRDDYGIGRAAGPLASAETVADVEAYGLPDPSWWSVDGLAAARGGGADAMARQDARLPFVDAAALLDLV